MIWFLSNCLHRYRKETLKRKEKAFCKNREEWSLELIRNCWTVFTDVSLVMLRLVGKLDFLYLSPKMSIKDQERSWDAEVQEWPRLTHSPQTTKTWRQGRRKLCSFSKKINQCGKYFHIHFKPETNLVWKKLWIRPWNKHLITPSSVKILPKTFSVLFVLFDT